MRMLRARDVVFAWALVAALLSACGYRPVSETAAGQTPNLQVSPITNGTYKPGLDAIVSAAILRQLRLTGQGPTASRPPDFVLSGSVINYENDAIASNPQDIGQRFRVRVTMQATLTPRTGGTPRLKENIVGQSFYTVGADVVGTRAAENDAAIRASQELARRLAARIMEEL